MHDGEHRKFMEHALELAKMCQRLGEVPVGALVVVDGEIVAKGQNFRELMTSCLEHAEIRALSLACRTLGRWRLTDATVYSTLEPCIMCAGALLHARVKRLVYGAKDPKFGAIESLFTLAADPRLNHRIEVVSDVMGEVSAQLLKDFFGNLRNTARNPNT